MLYFWEEYIYSLFLQRQSYYKHISSKEMNTKQSLEVHQNFKLFKIGTNISYWSYVKYEISILKIN